METNKGTLTFKEIRLSAIHLMLLKRYNASIDHIKAIQQSVMDFNSICINGDNVCKSDLSGLGFDFRRAKRDAASEVKTAIILAARLNKVCAALDIASVHGMDLVLLAKFFGIVVTAQETLMEMDGELY